MPYFNEIFEENGSVRPHYDRVYDHWSSMSAKRQRVLLARSRQMFSGDYHQDPLPRILTANEFEFLSRGVDQRARAIRAFLTDYMTKGRLWNSVMPAAVLNKTILRHHAENLLRETSPDLLAFPYGPDIIRDRYGFWRVVEDSAGVLGGLGDLVRSKSILYRLIPQLQSALGGHEATHDPLEFFGQLARHFSHKAAERGGVPLLYLHPLKEEPDGEVRRLIRIFSKFGIEWTTPLNPHRRLEFKEGRNGGMFLRTRGGGRERVGALIFRYNPESFDRTWRTAQLIRRLDSKRDMVLRDLVFSVDFGFGQDFFVRRLLGGTAWMNFSPCTQFVNDKIFGLYVDRMIHRLLKEDPLLKSIPAEAAATWSRKSDWTLNHDVIRRLSRDKDRYVVKRVDDDGGAGVWIGMKESRESLTKMLESLRAKPQYYIVQEFEHLSVLDNRIVDLRIYAHVDSERIIIGNTPWGRANWIHGDGKVNIGANGFVSPVVVLKNETAESRL